MLRKCSRSRQEDYPTYAVKFIKFRCVTLFVGSRPSGRFHLPSFSNPTVLNFLLMPHDHQHGNCGHEGHDHDHEHDQSGAGPQDNLFAHIDRDNVVALNTYGRGPEVIKPWNERLDEGVVRWSYSMLIIL